MRDSFQFNFNFFAKFINKHVMENSKCRAINCKFLLWFYGDLISDEFPP